MEKITRHEAEILKNHAPFFNKEFEIVKKDNDYFIDINDYERFFDVLLGDIINTGMDNMDTVNDIGRELYAIHDRIMYS